MKKIGFLLFLTNFMWSCTGSDSPQKADGTLVTIDTEEILRISDEYSEEYLFGRLNGVVVDADGHILAGDQSQITIYHFSEDGSYLGSFGQQGAGPGEFGQFFNLGITYDDSLYVQDVMQSRVITFGKNEDGQWAFGSTIALRRGDGGFPSQFHKISDGDFLVHYMRGVQTSVISEKPYLQLADRGGDVNGEKILELEPYQMHVIQSGNRVIAMGIPYTYHQPFTVSHTGHIYTGFNENLFISKYDHSGNHLLDIDFPVDPIEVSREEKDEAVSGFGESADEVRSRMPDIKPAFTRLLVSDTGDLWVHRGVVDELEVWLVFSDTGKPMFQVQLPQHFMVSRIRHGNIYGTLPDVDELVSIIVYRYIQDGSSEDFADGSR
ncbi:MAG: 6-bladed beta-propeller [Cyclonatronaceae bacterium]